MDRALQKDTLVIFDSMNYIKVDPGANDGPQDLYRDSDMRSIAFQGQSARPSV